MYAPLYWDISSVSAPNPRLDTVHQIASHVETNVLPISRMQAFGGH
jgi:hypothetical protein